VSAVHVFIFHKKLLTKLCDPPHLSMPDKLHFC